MTTKLKLSVRIDRIIQRTPWHKELVTVRIADLKCLSVALAAAEMLVGTVEATAGVIKSHGAQPALDSAVDRFDLANAYIVACAALDHEPKFAQQGGHR